MPRLWALLGFRPAWPCPCTAGVGCDSWSLGDFLHEGIYFGLWGVLVAAADGSGRGREEDHSSDQR